MTNIPISTIIEKYNTVRKKGIELNNIIKEYYEPRLTQLAQDDNKEGFGELLSEIPDCPFLMTAYRIEKLYFD